MASRFTPPTVERVVLRNYKNIAVCDVQLHALTLLVGPNGAGKSNFVDALRFVSDSLRTTAEHALRDRGGINEVRRRSRGHPTHFSIQVTLRLAKDLHALYGFRVGMYRNGAFRVQEEQCRIIGQGSESYFVVGNGDVAETSAPHLPPTIVPDRLYLTLASGVPEFRAVYNVLSHMGFYNLSPEQIWELQDPDPGDLLTREGSNLAAVVRRLRHEDPNLADRINEYLGAVVPGISSVEARSLGPKETLEFRQAVAGDEAPWCFFASNMSDGTLRVLGVLVAAFQGWRKQPPIPLVAIEEPEVAVHPGAAVRLMDALLEASQRTQLLITTHSPELLDHPGVNPEWILAVEARGNESRITPVRPEILQTVRENLYTVGELLRLDQLQPDERIYQRLLTQRSLFELGGTMKDGDRTNR